MGTYQASRFSIESYIKSCRALIYPLSFRSSRSHAHLQTLFCNNNKNHHAP